MEFILPAVYGMTGLGASGLAWFSLKSLVECFEQLTPQRRFGSHRSRIDRRCYERVRSRFEATVELSGPDGARISVPARGVDISKGGVMVKTARAIAPGSTVFVHLKSFQLVAFAEVLHCTPDGSRYRLGLQFDKEPVRAEAGIWEFRRI